MNRRSHISIICATFLFFGTYISGYSQIIATANIDELCKSSVNITYRSTIVYVDLSSIDAESTEWGSTILQKLALAPREQLTIVGLNPATLESIEVFDACFPTLTKKEIEQVANSRSLWDKLVKLDPDTQQRENLDTFDARLRNSLDRLLELSKKAEPATQSSILSAIAVDKNRFADERKTHRILIFTRAALVKGNFGTSVSDAVEQISEKYPASFSGAEVWVYGVKGASNGAAMAEAAKLYSAYFLKNWAYLRSFAPSLPQQSEKLVQPAIKMAGTFSGGGASGRIRLYITKVDEISSESTIWLDFVLGRTNLYVPLKGVDECDGDECAVRASVKISVPLLAKAPYFRKDDQLVLVGRLGEALEGDIHSAAQEVFSPENGAVKYTIRVAGE